MTGKPPSPGKPDFILSVSQNVCDPIRVPRKCSCRSKHHLQCELDLARIDSCTVDDAIVGLTQLSAGRIPDRMIRQVEDLGSKFHVRRLADRELLIERGVEVDDARTDDRIPRGAAIAE